MILVTKLKTCLRGLMYSSLVTKICQIFLSSVLSSNWRKKRIAKNLLEDSIVIGHRFGGPSKLFIIKICHICRCHISTVEKGKEIISYSSSDSVVGYNLCIKCLKMKKALEEIDGD